MRGSYAVALVGPAWTWAGRSRSSSYRGGNGVPERCGEGSAHIGSAGLHGGACLTPSLPSRGPAVLRAGPSLLGSRPLCQMRVASGGPSPPARPQGPSMSQHELEAHRSGTPGSGHSVQGLGSALGVPSLPTAVMAPGTRPALQGCSSWGRAQVRTALRSAGLAFLCQRQVSRVRGCRPRGPGLQWLCCLG